LELCADSISSLKIEGACYFENWNSLSALYDVTGQKITVGILAALKISNPLRSKFGL
jgi:hypothetical protein